MGPQLKTVIAALLVIWSFSSATIELQKSQPMFVRLPKVEPEEYPIAIAGVISTYNPYALFLVTELYVQTRYSPYTVYCDSYSSIAIGKEVMSNNSSTSAYGEQVSDVTITLRATAAVLNRALSDTGIKCAIYVNKHLRQFHVVYGEPGGGVKIPRDTSSTPFDVLSEIHTDTPALLYLLVSVLCVAIVIMVSIPLCVVKGGRK